MGRPSAAKIERREREIIALCRQHGSVNAKLVAAHMAVDHATGHRWVARMAEKGLLKPSQRGVYTLTGETQQPTPGPVRAQVPDGMVGIPSAIDVPPYLIEAALAALLHAGRQLAAALDHAPESTAIGETIEGMLREQSRQGGLLRLIQETTERHRKEVAA